MAVGRVMASWRDGRHRGAHPHLA